MSAQKPFAQSAENNRAPILAALRELFADRSAVLEIGSGTGQHAVAFAAALPHLQWHTSDLAHNHPGINAWIRDAALPNVHPPLELDVSAEDWQTPDVDAAPFDAIEPLEQEEPSTEAEDADTPDEDDSQEDRPLVVSDEPFQVEALGSMDGHVRWKVGEIVQPIGSIRDFEATVQLNDGHLDVDLISATPRLGGILSGSLDFGPWGDGQEGAGEDGGHQQTGVGACHGEGDASRRACVPRPGMLWLDGEVLDPARDRPVRLPIREHQGLQLGARRVGPHPRSPRGPLRR